jgi:hypothetical protein
MLRVSARAAKIRLDQILKGLFMKTLLLASLLASLLSAPAFATFRTECLPGLREKIAEDNHVESSKIKVGKRQLVKDASRPKLCGLRQIHGVNYSVKKNFEGQEYTSNGFLLIEYTCNGCETIKDYQDIE